MACEQLLCDFCFSCQFLYFKPLHHIRDSLHVHPTRLLFLPALFTHATAQIYYKSYFYTVYRGDLICVFLCSSPTIYYHMFCIRCFLVFISSSTTNISRSLTLRCSLLLLLLFLYDNYLYRQEAFVFFCLFFFFQYFRALSRSFACPLLLQHIKSKCLLVFFGLSGFILPFFQSVCVFCTIPLKFLSIFLFFILASTANL